MTGQERDAVTDLVLEYGKAVSHREHRYVAKIRANSATAEHEFKVAEAEASAAFVAVCRKLDEIRDADGMGFMVRPARTAQREAATR